MSGTFEDLDVPPTLISFAVTMGKTGSIVSPEFKSAGHRVVLLKPYLDEDGNGPGKGLPKADSLIKLWEKAHEMMESGEAVAAYTPGIGGIAEAVMKMSYGNGIGFSFEAMDLEDIFGYCYGGMLMEVTDDFEIAARHMDIELIGHTVSEKAISFGGESVSLHELLALYQGRLESVFPSLAAGMTGPVSNLEYRARSWHTPLYKRAEPKVLIPVFPGTNCEYDSARAIREAGGKPEIMVIKNRTSDEIGRSVEAFAQALKEAQIVFIPGGFSGGDEPDGSAKFINAFFRNAAVTEGVTELLEKNDGLMCGICNGFQALIKLGLVPFGKITDTDENCPTLTFNTLGSHQSKIVRVRVASNKSPWLRGSKVGDIYSVPISHGEGRFIAPDDVISKLAGMGQIATQYVDLDGNASSDILFNPNGSMMAIEGITSPDGRVFGKMGHAERVGKGLYRNVPGEYFMHMFENGIKYFK
jgi:phosphoribosylformylglycinamidine synthase